MFDTNEYFDGKVKSIAYETSEGPATIGVMAPGDYEFGTSKKEFMTVVSGKLVVLLPNEDEWKEYGPNETFIVDPNVKFKVKVEANTSYICLYR
ncbi:MAG: DUF1255 family protein [Candidatus Delongbacteria bacterium]|nr:DUF1255 family protein [Candidatus Delongbacteria bacterium]